MTEPDIPYRMNVDVIREFMRYHGLQTYREVAEIMGISAAYLSQLLKGTRALNEHMRLRLQLITRKSQDQLFQPNFDNALFSPQAFAMRKHYGVLPMLPKIEEDYGGQLEFGGFDHPNNRNGNGHYKKLQRIKKRASWRNPCATGDSAA